jgi:hypothetical protein
LIVNVSMPTGAFTVPWQTVVQLTVAGDPAEPPAGATVTAADCVAADTNFGVRDCTLVVVAGTAILKPTWTDCGAVVAGVALVPGAGAVDERLRGTGRPEPLPPPPQPAANMLATASARKRSKRMSL